MKNYYIILITLFSLISCSKTENVIIEFDTNSPQIVFAVNDLKTALITKHYTISEDADYKILFSIVESGIEKQGFTIQNNNKNIVVNATDELGLMYGGLELAELLKIGTPLTDIPNISQTPYIKKRGIKYNIPLDVRTSAFDDSGDAAQNNIAEMWNLEFWEEFFDTMARNRYNAISFWNAHPFSSMVKLDDYPDIALEDVCGTTIKPQENGNFWNVPEMPSSKIVANLKVLKKMTIDEKIVFWQKVMQHAKNRGIDVYFITWNICLNGAAPPGPNTEVGDKKGKYGITNDFRNEISKDYLRKSVKQFLINYPNVKGIGVTAGENMRTPMTDDDKEKWLWETYGLGILDAKEIQPNRTVNFIHRFWWTDMKIVKKYWGNYPDPFDMSFKYSKAHMYSGVNPPFAKPFIEWMSEENLKSWWNLRNDDIFIHRWGNPSYVRDFINHLPLEQTAGFHMGSDGYVWGREFISKQPETPRKLEIHKHWYKFLLWGRLGYNPTIENNRFKLLVADKFPNSNSELIFKTWTSASKIIPQVNRFHWRDWDYMWQPEACMEIWNDLRSVDAFRTTKTMAGSGILNIRDYVKATLKNQEITLKTPNDVIENLQKLSATSIKNATILLEDSNEKELEQTLLDMKSMGYLGEYYANKISAALELEFYKVTGKIEHKNKSIEHLQNGVLSWEAYKNINIDRYERQNFARLRTFDWEIQLKHVKAEIELVKNAKTYEEDPHKENTDKWK